MSAKAGGHRGLLSFFPSPRGCGRGGSNEEQGRTPMRAAIFRNGEIVVDQMPEPKPGPGQVLVKSLACGICGSDLHARKHAHRMVELSRHFPARKPMKLSRHVVLVHEFCCEEL